MTVAYLGDYAEDSTVEVYWTTHAANGGAVTYAGGTLRVYKDHGTSAITSGITVSKDHNGKTGIHIATIDLSASASYTTGSYYALMIDAATVDGQTYTRWLGSWSIDAAYFARVWRTPVTGNTVAGTFGKYVYVIFGKLPTGDMVDSDDVNAACDTAFSDYDPPTYNEMVARTLLTADYFDPASDTVLANVKQISDSATSADKLELSTLSIVSGTATAVQLTTSYMSTNLTEATNNHYNGRLVIWTSGNLQNQAATITSYNGTTKTLGYTTTTEAPAENDTFIIL